MDDWIGLTAVAILALWSVTTWRGGVLLVREVRRAIVSGHPVEALSIVLGVTANLLNILYELGRRVAGWPNYPLPLPDPVRIGGLTLAAAGFGLAILARRTLGVAWTVVPAPPGTLRTRGLYGVVRHPIYAAATLLYAGLLLAQGNATGALVFGAQITGFGIKAWREDRFLSRHAPAAYVAYRSKVRWRMLPGIW